MVYSVCNTHTPSQTTLIIIIIIITKTMFTMLSSWQSHCESSPSSFDECRMAPSGRRPKTKPDDLGRESACTGCQKLHPPSPFIIILSPKADTHFTIPQRVEGWVDLAGWLHSSDTDSSGASDSFLTIRHCAPYKSVYYYYYGFPIRRWSPILVLTGSGVVQLRWSKPTRYH